MLNCVLFFLDNKPLKKTLMVICSGLVLIEISEVLLIFNHDFIIVSTLTTGAKVVEIQHQTIILFQY